MCRFKPPVAITFTSTTVVSIHPMCRFKIKPAQLQDDAISFNTSYVSVQVQVLVNSKEVTLFQYILCVGSRYLTKKVTVNLKCFNTSYVSVQAVC